MKTATTTRFVGIQRALKNLLFVPVFFGWLCTGFSQTTYTFSTAGEWNVLANWSGGNYPPDPLPAGDFIVINADCIRRSDLTINGTLTVNAGSTLEVYRDYDGEDYTFTNNGTINNSGTLELTTFKLINNAGSTITNFSGATFTIRLGANLANFGTFVNNPGGTLSILMAGAVNNENGGIFTNNGAVSNGWFWVNKTGSTLNNNAAFSGTDVSGAINNDGGTINLNTGSTMTALCNFENTGTLNLNTGGNFFLSKTPVVWPEGVFNWNSGSTVTVGGVLTIASNDTITIPTGAILARENGNAITVENGGRLINNGTFTPGTGALTVNSGGIFTNNATGTITLATCILNNYGITTNRGVFNLNQTTGDIINHIGGIFANNSSGSVNINGNRKFENYGTTTNQGTFEIVMASGAIYNYSGGIFTNSAGVVLVKGVLSNVGTFNLNGGNLTLEANPAVLPGGTFNWNAGGTVVIGTSGVMTLSNTLIVQIGRTLSIFATTPFTIANTGHLINSGTVSVHRPLINNGTLTNTNLLQTSSSVFDNALLTNNGTLNNSGTIQLGKTFTNNGILNFTAGQMTFSYINALYPAGTFNWSGGVFRIPTGYNMTINSNSTIPSGGELQIQSGAVLINNFAGLMTNNGTLTNNGTFTNNGTLKNNNTNFTNAGIFNLTGTLELNTNPAVLPAGTFNWNSLGTLKIGPAGVMTLTNTLTVPADRYLTIDPSGVLIIENSGQLINIAIINIYGSIVNNGILINSSYLEVWASGTLTANGTVFNDTGATLYNSGTLAINGTVSNETGATLLNSGGTLAINSGGTLTNSSLDFSNYGIINLSGTLELNTNPAVLPAGTFNWNTGGSVKIGSSGVMTLANTFTVGTNRILSVESSGVITIIYGGELINNGTVSIYGLITNDGTFTNANVLQIFPGGSLSNNGSGVLNNSTTLTNNGALTNHGTLNNNGTLVNNNTLNNPGGILNNNGSLANNATFTNNFILNNNSGGTLNNNSGSTLTNAWTLINNGTLANNNGGTLTNTLTLTNNTTLNNAGTLNNNSHDMANNGTLNNSGALNNNGTLANNGMVDNSGGTLTNNFTLINIAILNNYSVLINQGSLSNHGVLSNEGNLSNNSSGTLTNTYTGTLANGGLLVNDGVLTNNATLTNNNIMTNNSGGTFNNDNGSTLTNDGTLTNNGTLTNAGSFANFSVLTNNSILINSGNLTNDSGGNFTIANASVLNNISPGVLENSAVLTIHSGGALTNNSELINDGTLTNNGALINNTGSNLFIYSGAMLTNNSNLTNSGTLTNYYEGTLANTQIFDNNGDLANTGLLANDGFLTNSGTLTNHNDGALTNSGNLNTSFGSYLFNFGVLSNYNTLNHTGYLNNDGELTIYGGAIHNNGYLGNSFSGTLTIFSGAELRSNNPDFYNDGVLNLEGILELNYSPAEIPGGTFNWNSGGTVEVGSSGRMSIDSDLTVEADRFLSVEPSGILYVSNGALFNEGYISIYGELFNYNTLSNLGFLEIYGTLTNFNQLTTDGLLYNENLLVNNHTITINSSGELYNYNNLTNDGSFSNDGTVYNSGSFFNHTVFLNNAIFHNDNELINDNTLTNYGELYNNNMLTNSTGGTLHNHNTLSNYGSLTNIYGGTFNNYNFLDNSSGGQINNEGSDFYNFGTLVNNGYFQVTDNFLNNGLYEGEGNFYGNLFINEPDGTIAPGNSPGCMVFENGIENYGTLHIELGGTISCSEHDYMTVIGTVRLDGTLMVTLTNGYTGNQGDILGIIEGSDIYNAFAVLNLPSGWDVDYSSTTFTWLFFGALPVELTDFSAKIIDKNVQLDWQTASETNNYGFYIERSWNGQNWEQLGFVEGHGSSASAHTYSFLDEKPLSGISYYRLHQVDFDGKADYSKIVPVNFGAPKNDLVVSPNPAQDEVKVTIPEGGTALEIYDATGRLVQSQQLVFGDASAIVNLEILQAGVYLVLVKTETGVKSARVLKQ